MQPDQETLERIQEQTNTTEQEARAIYHLTQARNVMKEFDRDPDMGVNVARHARIFNLFDELFGVVGERVLKRQYHGWPHDLNL